MKISKPGSVESPHAVTKIKTWEKTQMGICENHRTQNSKTTEIQPNSIFRQTQVREVPRIGKEFVQHNIQRRIRQPRHTYLYYMNIKQNVTQ